MCWGTFCYIPGPKKWDEEARPYMLAWLPAVGAVMGALWALCLLIIENAGHFCFIDKPNKFNMEVKEFLLS